MVKQDAALSVYSIFLHLVLVALCVGVWVTKRASDQLVLINQELRQQIEPALEPPVKAGGAIGPLEVETLAGEPLRLATKSPSDRERLLFFFTTECPSCLETQSRWRELHGRLGGEMDIVGISLSTVDRTQFYVQEQTLPFPVVVSVDPRAFAEKHRISLVPLTVHVDKFGKVLGAWQGVLSGREIAGPEPFGLGSAWAG